MVRFLEYKCQWYGRTLVKIDRFFPSSKRCGHCGRIVDKLPLKIREWTCPKCSIVHDRDINAAHNILAAGLAVLAGKGEQALKGVPPVVATANPKGEEVCGANIRPEGHKFGGQLRKTREGRKQKPKS